LALTLRMKAVAMAVSILLVFATVYLFERIPKGFLPNEDQGRLTVNTEAIQGITFDDMTRHQDEAAAVLAQHPAVFGFTNQVGQNGAINAGRMNVDLKPRS